MSHKMSLKNTFEEETGDNVYPYGLFSPVSMNYVVWLENKINKMETKRVGYLRTIARIRRLTINGWENPLPKIEQIHHNDWLEDRGIMGYAEKY